MSKRKKEEYFDAFLNDYSFNLWIPNALDRYLIDIAEDQMPQFHSNPSGKPFSHLKFAKRIEKANFIEIIEAEKSSITPLEPTYANLCATFQYPLSESLRIDIADPRNYSRMKLGINIIHDQSILVSFIIEDEREKDSREVINFSSAQPNLEEAVARIKFLHNFCRRTMPPPPRVF